MSLITSLFAKVVKVLKGFRKPKVRNPAMEELFMPVPLAQQGHSPKNVMAFVVRSMDLSEFMSPEEGRIMNESFRLLIESYPHNISGLLTAWEFQGEELTERQSDVIFLIAEKYGMSVTGFFDKLKELYKTVPKAKLDKLTFDIMFVEPDALYKTAVASWSMTKAYVRYFQGLPGLRDIDATRNPSAIKIEIGIHGTQARDPEVQKYANELIQKANVLYPSIGKAWNAQAPEGGYRDWS